MTGPWSLVLGSWSAIGLVAAGAFAQEPKVAVRDVARVTARIDRVDPFSRSLNLRTAEGLLHNVYVGPELKIFDELRSGDSITVRFTDSVVVAVKPNAKTTVVQDNTASAKKEARDADVLQQLKVTVTIEAVDAAKQLVTYKSADNRSVTRAVVDRRLIEDLKRGDIVEVTYTRERAIEITKNR